ncbi:MAG: hypothetical protein HY754_13490 [Nitrospirae bacterium]|nr:hypothetical protein [Nitrospirota bacterium]
MIITIPTKYAAGITLYGDYWDLNSLYETIHSLVEDCPLNEGLKEAVLGLAYDIRHAYQKDREEKEFGNDEYNKVVYRGEKILWPIILFQVQALRYCASFQPTFKEQQANLYRLESCLEASLMEVDSNIGNQCIQWINIPLMLTPNYYSLFLSEVSKNYITGPVGENRFKKLPKTLNSLHAMSKEYNDFAIYLEDEAEKQGCSPHDLHDTSDGVDFKW